MLFVASDADVTVLGIPASPAVMNVRPTLYVTDPPRDEHVGDAPPPKPPCVRACVTFRFSLPLPLLPLLPPLPPLPILALLPLLPLLRTLILKMLMFGFRWKL